MLFKKFFLSLFALLLLLEEFLWDILTALGDIFARLFKLERFDEWLRHSSPQIALLAFGIPVLILTPVNLFAFYLIAKGLIIYGILIEIVVKLFGTFLVARIFSLTKPQLLQFGWFSWLYVTIITWLEWAHKKIRDTAIYRLTVRIKNAIKPLFMSAKATFISIKKSITARLDTILTYFVNLFRQ